MEVNPYETPQAIGQEPRAKVPVDAQIFWWTVFNVVVLTTIFLIAVFGRQP
jgi:hypothetical protein